jgi:hypothetical protein
MAQAAASEPLVVRRLAVPAKLPLSIHIVAE